MALIFEALVEILRKPTISGVLAELLLFCGPLWVAVLVGLVVGWLWKPKWAAGWVGGEEKEKQNLLPSSDGCGGSVLGFPSFDYIKSQLLPNSIASLVHDNSCRHKGDGREQQQLQQQQLVTNREIGGGGKKLVVTEADLEHLSKLVDVTDGGPEWIPMMGRSLPTFSYQAWRRDPQTGPPQYTTRTLFEDVTPEIMRDFFWDDVFRVKAKWDDMLLHHEILQECPVTGTLIIHWIRKFPFFCSDREYTIGRRIWNSDGTYYCVTKGVPYPDLPRRNKPRRVDLYYSSWCIRAAKSRIDGQMTACEVILFHHEDMGIPWELAKLGIRQGMWGTIKKIDPGLRAYQAYRKEAGVVVSKYALMASVNTNVNPGYLKQLEMESNAVSSNSEVEDVNDDKQVGRSLPRLLIVGGAVALAFTLDRGLLTKAVIFGVARKLAKAGR